MLDGSVEALPTEYLYDEVPFLEFGHLGTDRIDMRVFGQNIWWVDRRGRATKITELKNGHLRNILNFLEEHCSHFYEYYVKVTTLDSNEFHSYYNDPDSPLLYKSSREWLFSTFLYSGLLAEKLRRGLK
jgi:hypothetical protein